MAAATETRSPPSPSGRRDRDAIAAFATAFREFATRHAGRYTATVGARFTGPGDPSSPPAPASST